MELDKSVLANLFPSNKFPLGSPRSTSCKKALSFTSFSQPASLEIKSQNSSSKSFQHSNSKYSTEEICGTENKQNNVTFTTSNSSLAISFHEANESVPVASGCILNTVTPSQSQSPCILATVTLLQQRDHLATCVATLQRQRDAAATQARQWHRQLENIIRQLQRKSGKVKANKSPEDVSENNSPNEEEVDPSDSLEPRSFDRSQIEQIEEVDCVNEEMLRLYEAAHCSHSEAIQNIILRDACSEPANEMPSKLLPPDCDRSCSPGGNELKDGNVLFSNKSPGSFHPDLASTGVFEARTDVALGEGNGEASIEGNDSKLSDTPTLNPPSPTLNPPSSPVPQFCSHPAYNASVEEITSCSDAPSDDVSSSLSLHQESVWKNSSFTDVKPLILKLQV